MSKSKASDRFREKIIYIQKIIRYLKSDEVKVVNLEEYRKLKADLESARIALERFE